MAIMGKTKGASTSSRTVIPRGRPKSGRVWKSPRQRSSTVVAVKPWKKSWDKHMQERYDKKKIKEQEKEMKEKAKEEVEDRRKRVEENQKRREENRKKAEVLQKITNPRKLKRLKKKQMKNIEKR